jgi:hypothetical protein
MDVIEVRHAMEIVEAINIKKMRKIIEVVNIIEIMQSLFICFSSSVIPTIH